MANCTRTNPSSTIIWIQSNHWDDTATYKHNSQVCHVAVWCQRRDNSEWCKEVPFPPPSQRLRQHASKQWCLTPAYPESCISGKTSFCWYSDQAQRSHIISHIFATVAEWPCVGQHVNEVKWANQPYPVGMETGHTRVTTISCVHYHTNYVKGYACACSMQVQGWKWMQTSMQVLHQWSTLYDSLWLQRPV